MTRKIAFDKLENFRDFGGYSGNGRQMARGRFFRSASHADATDNDLMRLADMGFDAIVDLRRPVERNRAPSRRWSNFAAAVVENDDDYEGEVDWHSSFGAHAAAADDFRKHLLLFYSEAPRVPRHVDLFTRYFDKLAESKGAFLVHCAAGKDRTGMIVALTHTLAGVHEDDIFADYMLTNDAERFSRMGPAWLSDFEKRHGRRPEEGSVEALMGVHEDYLHAAFKTMRESHGDLLTYIRDGLGVDDAKRAKIEKRLFE
ncbi:MAG: tyrosine-protein phosphatase [Caulobacterales bacterium]